jgi:hypothetical protein
MTEVKHFDDVFVFANPVVNKNGAVLQFPYARPFSYCATHAGEQAKQIHMVEKSAAKTHGCLAIVLGNVADDVSEVA